MKKNNKKFESIKNGKFDAFAIKNSQSSKIKGGRCQPNPECACDVV